MKGNVARNVVVAPGAGRTTPMDWHWARNAELGGWSKTQFAQGLHRGDAKPGSCYVVEWERGANGNAVRLVATSEATAPRNLRCKGKRPVCYRSATGARGNCGAAACVRLLRRSQVEAVRA